MHCEVSGTNQLLIKVSASCTRPQKIHIAKEEKSLVRTKTGSPISQSHAPPLDVARSPKIKLQFWVDKAPRLSISIVICILSSDTETSAATPLGGGARKVLAK